MATARAPTGVPRSATVGVNVKACFEGLGPAQGLRAAAEAGFEDIVLWAGEDLEFADTAWQARATGLRPIALATPKLTASDERTGAVLKRIFAAALVARAPMVALIFGDAEDGWAPAPSTLDALRAAPVPIAIENTADAMGFTASAVHLNRLVGSLDCGIVLDLGHAILAAADPQEFDRSRVAWTDLHDNDGAVDRHLPLGAGTEAGDSCAALTASLARGRVVIETDPTADDFGTWVESLQADREAATRALASFGAPQEVSG